MLKPESDLAMSTAACPNASAPLFTGVKISPLGLLPQGQPERHSRALNTVAQGKEGGFDNCTNIGECEAVSPKGIQFENIARMNRAYLFGAVMYREPQAEAGAG